VSDTEEKLSWEWRIFWPEYSAARDKLADFPFMEMVPKKTEKEEHPDLYCHLPNTFLNIKFRDDELMVKQMLEKEGDLCGYTKKRSYTFPVTARELPLFLPEPNKVYETCNELVDDLQKHYSGAKVYTVEKKRTSSTFVRQGEEKRKLKAEYSVIKCEGKTFQTLCLESKHRKWLSSIIEKVDTKGGIICDYFRLLGLLSFNKV
jgi:hypothetical protein